jgi:hypothetical protein
MIATSRNDFPRRTAETIFLRRVSFPVELFCHDKNLENAYLESITKRFKVYYNLMILTADCPAVAGTQVSRSCWHLAY